MACLNFSGVNISGYSNENILKHQIYDPKFNENVNFNTPFMGQSLVVPDQKTPSLLNLQSHPNFSVKAQATYCVSKAMRWWEKTLKPNMVEIHSANQLVDALKFAGDSLVILHFYSPGCGGCKSLHPKICQFAESNPDAIFLKVNYEELKPMCHALHIHVLPFFRFYRGTEGKVCSFSCTISTIKKFKDALAKYKNMEISGSFGSAKGLDESELLKLASIGELSSNSPSPSLINQEEYMENLVLANFEMNQLNISGNEDKNALLVA